MKNFFRITALCLVMILSLSMLASCLGGKSMDDIVDKIKDLDEDDYMYEKAGSDEREMMLEAYEDELDIKFEGDIETLYRVSDGKHYAMVFEFEESADAKELETGFKEYLEDADEDDLDADPDDFIVERSGNIVIISDDEDLVDEIW